MLIFFRRCREIVHVEFRVKSRFVWACVEKGAENGVDKVIDLSLVRVFEVSVVFLKDLTENLGFGADDLGIEGKSLYLRTFDGR